MSRAMAESDLYLRPSNSNPSRSTDRGAFGAVPFAHQPRAHHGIAGICDHGFSARLALDLVGEGIEELGCLARNTAVGQFLNSVRQTQLKEAATVVRCVDTKQGLPFRLQIVDRQTRLAPSSLTLYVVAERYLVGLADEVRCRQKCAAGACRRSNPNDNSVKSGYGTTFSFSRFRSLVDSP